MHDGSSQPQWRQLFDRHAAGLILFARQWCRSHSDAEDVVQEVFVHRWRSALTADDPAAYLFACVRHAAMDQLRSEHRRRQREQSAAANRQPNARQTAFDTPLEHQERAAMIEQELARLPDEQRHVIVLKIWAGLTFAQIAQVLEASPNTVASRYRYGLESLRESLVQELMT